MMALARMIREDEDALICDFAETYHIYNYKALPPTVSAILACGLRPDSRIMQKLTGAKAPAFLLLEAGILDRLSWLVWAQSDDGRKGTNRPKSIVDEMLGNDSRDIVAFDSAEDFERARAEILRKAGDCNG